MTTQNPSIEQGLDIYKQSPGLLFQFILNDFLNTTQESKNIEKIYRKIERSLIKNRLLAEVSDHLHQLLDFLSVLNSPHMASEKNTLWGKEAGYLSKLHEYCYLFNLQKNFNPRASEDLNSCVSQAYHSCLLSRESILSILQHHSKKEHIESDTIPDYAGLYKLLDDLLDNLQRASRLILQIIISSKDDENVLFFIFKNQERLTNSYPSFSLSRLLNRMFPNGLKEAKTFLISRYSERGFKELLEEISLISSKVEDKENHES
jgi:hypothetical protein